VLLESAISKWADACICNTEQVFEKWRNRYPNRTNKIHLIWNGFDPDQIPTAEPGKHLIRKIVHVGTLYGGRDPRPVLKSIARLVRSQRILAEDVELTLAGPVESECLPLLLPCIQELESLGCMRFDNRKVPSQEAEVVSSAADAHLIIDTNDKGCALQVPAKLFTSVRSGSPILALTYKGSPTEQILSQSGVRHCCVYPQMSEGSVDESVLRFLTEKIRSAKPNEWFNETFDGRKQARRLAEILEQVR
jgi:hypothetical protein